MSKELKKTKKYIFKKYFCNTCGSDSVKKDNSCFENNVIWCDICKCNNYMTYNFLEAGALDTA